MTEAEVMPERGRFLVIVVEFIYTYSPSEKARLDRGEELPELTD